MGAWFGGIRYYGGIGDGAPVLFITRIDKGALCVSVETAVWLESQPPCFYLGRTDILNIKHARLIEHGGTWCLATGCIERVLVETVFILFRGPGAKGCVKKVVP